MTWVKFHGELCEGAKRGIPRAVRFIYLELSHKARPGRGSLALPLGMSDLDALQDVLGGDRREVKDALRLLTSGDDPMVRLEGEVGARTLVIASWSRWNAGTTEAIGASTGRSRRHRNGEATAMQRPLHGDATAVASVGANEVQQGATVGLQESREEEKREDPPVVPRGDSPASPAAKAPKGDRATRCPDMDDAGLDAWLEAEGLPTTTDRVYGREVRAFIGWHNANKPTSLKWRGSWATWRLKAEKRGDLPAAPVGQQSMSSVMDDLARKRRERMGAPVQRELVDIAGGTK